MINTPLKLHNVISLSYADISNYAISFGVISAPYTLDIFYGMECGFSREFLQNDFKAILETFVLTEKVFIRVYPAALDPMTARFAELISMVQNITKQQLFMQLCQNASDNIKLLPEKSSESVFFDVTKILAAHPEISETLMIKINGALLQDIPSFYALTQAIV